MIKFDNEKCIGCGLCSQDCTAGSIYVNPEGKACFPKGGFCIQCGHCIAICPTGAVEITEYDMNESLEAEGLDYSIEPETLLNFIKMRRSCRHFTDEPVSDEDINMILEAGRFTPTGRNFQGVSFRVVRENIPELKKITFEILKKRSDEIKADPNADMVNKSYAVRWGSMYENFLKDPDGPEQLLFNATTFIGIVGDVNMDMSAGIVDASLAASSMESMVNALGLGGFFCGFFVIAAESEASLRDYLGIADNQRLVATLCIGHKDPAFEYKRTVPRKALNVKYI